MLSQVSTSAVSNIDSAYGPAGVDFTRLLALHVAEPQYGIFYNTDQSPALNGATAVAADHAGPVLLEIQQGVRTDHAHRGGLDHPELRAMEIHVGPGQNRR